MSSHKGHLGVAQFSRPCPVCGREIEVGSFICKQMIGDNLYWMHKDCYRPGGLARYTKALDDEFRRVTAVPAAIRISSSR